MENYEICNIETIYTEPFDGKVYNLEVEEDNSYTVNGYAVHNCESFTYWAWYHMAYKGDYAYLDDKIPSLSKRLQAPKRNNLRQNGALCFVGSTLVLTQDGLKPIKDIEVGEMEIGRASCRERV